MYVEGGLQDKRKAYELLLMQHKPRASHQDVSHNLTISLDISLSQLISTWWVVSCVEGGPSFSLQQAILLINYCKPFDKCLSWYYWEAELKSGMVQIHLKVVNRRSHQQPITAQCVQCSEICDSYTRQRLTVILKKIHGLSTSFANVYIRHKRGIFQSQKIFSIDYFFMWVV